MTSLPDDLLDPLEARLIRRVRGYTDAAVVPIDPVAIAATVAATRRRGNGSFGRLGGLGRLGRAGRLIVGAAALGVLAATSALVINGPLRDLGVGAAPACGAGDVYGQTLGWFGAAAGRITTIEIVNGATEACTLPEYRLALVDDAGRGRTLISSPAIEAGVALRPGQMAQTTVLARDYCQAQPPVQPITVRFDSPTGGEGLVLDWAVGDIGVPPCNAGPGSTGTIEQEPWQVGPWPPVARACWDEIDAVTTSWDGAAGSRIATVELRQIGRLPCSVDPLPRPALIDGNYTYLIEGQAGAGEPILLKPGDVLHTLVEVSNYCGPEPTAPVLIGFSQGDVTTFPFPRDAAIYYAAPSDGTDTSGVPPCNGAAQPAHIEMRPWSRTPY